METINGTPLNHTEIQTQPFFCRVKESVFTMISIHLRLSFRLAEKKELLPWILQAKALAHRKHSLLQYPGN